VDNYLHAAGADAHREDVPPDVAWLADAGERVKYAIACAAARQANARAQEIDELSVGDWKVFTNLVLEVTQGYSKLADYVAVAQLTPAGMDERTARRAVKKLASRGIINYKPGSGRGNRSIVGLPRVGEGGHLLVHLSAAKDGQPDVRLYGEKGGHSRPEKVDTHADAHAGAIPIEVFREDLREDDVDDSLRVVPTVDDVLAMIGSAAAAPSQRNLIEEGLRADATSVFSDAENCKTADRPIAALTSLLKARRLQGWPRSTPRNAPPPRTTYQRALDFAHGSACRQHAPENRRDVLEANYRGLTASQYDELERLAVEPIADAA
jgi:hypothetical protein